MCVITHETVLPSTGACWSFTVLESVGTFGLSFTWDGSKDL